MKNKKLYGLALALVVGFAALPGNAKADACTQAQYDFSFKQSQINGDICQIGVYLDNLAAATTQEEVLHWGSYLDFATNELGMFQSELEGILGTINQNCSPLL